MAQNHILLLGAHGNISRMMIPKFLAKKWNVTALIRNFEKKEDLEAQKNDILETRSKIPKDVKDPGTLDILVHSLSDVKTSKDAQSVIDKVKGVNWVVWSAGAGGKGGPEMTKAIDRDAAVAFAHAATHNDQIERYLIISALTSRRHPAEWLPADVKKGTEGGMKVYTQSKLVADECLTIWGNERRAKDSDFRYIVLRPGGLVNDLKDYPSLVKGSIQLGRTTEEIEKSVILRDDVASTAVELLNEGANGWFDLLQSKKKEEDNKINGAVRDAMKDGKDVMEGENEGEMRKTADMAFSEKWDSYCDAIIPYN